MPICCIVLASSLVYFWSDLAADGGPCASWRSSDVADVTEVTPLEPTEPSEEGHTESERRRR